MDNLLPIDEVVDPNKKPCNNCGALIAIDGRFCNSCGARQPDTTAQSFNSNWLMLKTAALFYAIYILSCALVKFVKVFDDLFWLRFFEAVLAATAVTFFCINWDENKRLLVWRNFSWRKLAAYGAIAMTAQVIVHYSVGWLNIVIFSKDEQYFYFITGNYLAIAELVFFTAVMPALFEELGFRGYLLQTILKVSDKEQAIYISAFLFAIIHLSLISLFWLIPFALFAGYVRIKEDTLWYGIAIHFLFNLTACIFQVW